MDRGCKSAASAGFTLLELLVALTLTGCLALAAFASLNISVKAVRQGQAEAERLQEVRVGRDILSRSLSSALPGTLDQKVYFDGQPQQMRFFTLLPLEAHNPGGPYHWRVLKAVDESGRGVVAVEQTRNLNWERDPEGVEVRQIILRGVTSLSFSYGRGGEEFDQWQADKERRLPDWVRVRLTMIGQEPQMWLIPLQGAKDERVSR